MSDITESKNSISPYDSSSFNISKPKYKCMICYSNRYAKIPCIKCTDTIANINFTNSSIYDLPYFVKDLISINDFNELKKLIVEPNSNNFFKHKMMRYCVRNKKIRVAKWLHELFPKIIFMNTDDYILIFDALMDDNLEILNWIYSVDPLSIYSKQHEYTLLHAACMSWNLDVIKWIYNHDPTQVFSKVAGYNTPIIFALEYGRFDIANFLYQLEPRQMFDVTHPHFTKIVLTILSELYRRNVVLTNKILMLPVLSVFVNLYLPKKLDEASAQIVNMHYQKLKSKHDAVEATRPSGPTRPTRPTTGISSVQSLCPTRPTKPSDVNCLSTFVRKIFSKNVQPDQSIQGVQSTQHVQEITSEFSLGIKIVESRIRYNTKIKPIVDNTKIKPIVDNTKIKSIVDNTKIKSIVDNTKIKPIAHDLKPLNVRYMNNNQLMIRSSV